MTETLSRRSFAKLGLMATTAALASRSRPGLAADGGTLRMAWWGAQERADRTQKALDLFHQRHPEVSIDAQSSGWDDYWPRLATQTAGGDAPDILQMDYAYIVEYARRGALLPLDELMPKPLDIASFDPTSRKAGTIEGKTYGVTCGVNSTCVIYDTTVLEHLGLPQPGLDWTWDEFAQVAGEIGKAGKGKVFGSADAAFNQQAMEIWVRQHGKPFYTEDGRLGFDADDAAAWYAFWDDLRKKQGAAPAEVQALDTTDDVETSLITLGKAAMTFVFSNQIVSQQAAVQDRLGLTMFPHGGKGSPPGQYLNPSMLFSVSAQTGRKEESARLIDFLVTDPQAVQVLGAERGVPPSIPRAAELEHQLDGVARLQVDYIAAIRDKVGDLPPPPPKGVVEIDELMKRVAEEVAFGKLTPKEGGKALHDEAQDILART